MKITRQKKTIEQISALIVLCGAGIVFWSIVFPAEIRPIPIRRQPPPATPREPFTELAALPPLLDRQLQGPLIPVKKQEQKETAAWTPEVPWPDIKLECVFVGSKSMRAVFRINDQSFSCLEGETFQQFTVSRLASKSAELLWQGRSKVFYVSAEAEEETVSGAAK